MLSCHMHDNPSDFLKAFRNARPVITGFDTETTGLNIGDDVPFLFVFGFLSRDHKEIHTVVIPTEQLDIIKQMFRIFSTTKLLLAANIKYDLHMANNVGITIDYNNLADIQHYIRAAHDHVSARAGGVRLGLKDYATKYIDRNANTYDKAIQRERAKIAKGWNAQLKSMSGKPMRYWKNFFSDILNDVTDLPEEDYEVYIRWKKETLPTRMQDYCGVVVANDVPYSEIPENIITPYAHKDVELLFKIYLKTSPVVKTRGTENSIELENSLILPVYDMERHGLTIDKEYIQTSKQAMREEIYNQRTIIWKYLPEGTSAYARKELSNYITSVTGEEPVGLDDSALHSVLQSCNDSGLHELVNALRKLRTLEKWYTTYLKRFDGVDKVYTQINLVGAASLRMSSDFQQFPHAGICDDAGTELFNPRRAVIVEKGQYVYIDYSQIELRLQAVYTILLRHPDVNLCRAYMPYQCTSFFDGEFDYNNRNHIQNTHTIPWVYNEDNTTKWTPTDVHGATTKLAFNITEDHPDYKELRGLGKRVNFAKNYGAQYTCISKLFPNESPETIKKIDEAYYKAFPGIKKYHDYCYAMGSQPYATNLLGFRYWGSSGHNLINQLIQGSAAILLKLKLRECHDYIKTNNVTGVSMIMPIHDEIQFHVTSDAGMEHILKLKEIMETWEDSPIPIVADIEYTSTNWADKTEVTPEELLCVRPAERSATKIEEYYKSVGN